MHTRRVARQIITTPVLTSILLTACQSNLPALDSYPAHDVTSSTLPSKPKPDDVPKVGDVVKHVQCELARIINTSLADSRTHLDGNKKSAQFLVRLLGNSDLPSLSTKLVDANFVATVQLTLEVTDVEGLAPSITFQNAIMGHHTGTLGGQVTGTQDRNVTLNYAIDLSRLTPFQDSFCDKSSSAGTQSGIQGDLGLADIVADGLLSLGTSSSNNVYASIGPTPPAFPLAISHAEGIVHLPPVPASQDGTLPPIPQANPPIDFVDGTLLIAPQSAIEQTQGTISFNGLLSIQGRQYFAEWTGNIVPPNSHTQFSETLFFNLTGGLTAAPANDNDLRTVESQWGVSPTVTLTGSIDSAYSATSLKLSGTIAPASLTNYSRATTPIRIELYNHTGQLHIEAASPKATAATPSPSAGGTSFGSLVDFTFVYGFNGSPLFTWMHVVTVPGSTSLGSYTKTSTDSMAISFVPACRKAGSTVNVPPQNFWDSIPICNDLAAAQQVGASVGYQNNSLMILRNFLVRPQ